MNKLSTAANDSLWTLFDTTQTHVQSLENLDIKGDKYVVMLLTRLIPLLIIDHNCYYIRLVCWIS